MLLRVCLILAIVAGLAVTGVTWFMVRPQVQQIVTDRDFNKGKWTEFETKYGSSQRELKTTQETLRKTEGELEVTKADLSANKARADQQQKRADDLQVRLEKTTTERNEAQQTLAQWDALGIPVTEVKGLIDTAKNLQQAVAALEAEKQVVIAVNKRLKDQLDQLLDPLRPVALDSKLRGKVMAVDPKWEFVVLNIGEKDNLKPNGVLMVVRDGHLVGNVKVSDVRENTSIANIMPGWEITSIAEGDVVAPYHITE